MEHLDAMSRVHASDGAVGGADAVVEPIETEGAHVDGGGGGAEDEDEAEEIFDVPALGHLDVLGVHAVPGDGDL